MQMMNERTNKRERREGRERVCDSERDREREKLDLLDL